MFIIAYIFMHSSISTGKLSIVYSPIYLLNSRSKINNLRIGDLAIAGTHNAGAWKFNTEVSSASRDSFILCQDRSIWGQLVHGIRYFDFRIAYYDFYPNVEDR